MHKNSAKISGLNKFFLKIFFPAVLCLIAKIAYPGSGDVIKIISHDKVKVVTDPSKGNNPYSRWVVFPSGQTEFRKAALNIIYQCPDSQRCGEWDYIDYIYLRRKGSLNDTSLDIELARMISPYGSRFTPDWKFKWKCDITDFSFLLHDSVEIEFNHNGYESNTDRGWVITLEFELIEGSPAAEVVGFEKLWTGKFPYGNPEDQIENYLTPQSFKNNYGADFARLKILQTGHGMDEKENCSEFCSKYRKIFVDGELLDQRQIWRECGDNALYPQAGTWIFDRANWCPGAIVFPDNYDFKLYDNKEHSIEIEMQPYQNSGSQEANYVFSSYLIYYKNPVFENDVSLEEIISPGIEDIHSRENPVCCDSKIKIRNNGLNVLNNLEIEYGFENEEAKTFHWKGNLMTFGQTDIILPGIYLNETDAKDFRVVLKNPNGKPDEYNYDNSGKSKAGKPPVFDKKIILTIKTNNEPGQNYYKILDGNKSVLKQAEPGEFKKNKIYRDTIKLFPGCYEFIFNDSAHDGLDFWYNEEGGYGYVRFIDTTGKLVKSFNPDFGSGIRQQFIVTGRERIGETMPPVLNIFPVRNSGKFSADIFLNKKQNVYIQITTEDKSKIIYKKKLKNFKEGSADIDISKHPDGFYFVNLICKNESVSRKIKVKRD